jgi:hypothetical protein
MSCRIVGSTSDRATNPAGACSPTLASAETDAEAEAEGLAGASVGVAEEAAGIRALEDQVAVGAAQAVTNVQVTTVAVSRAARLRAADARAERVYPLSLPALGRSPRRVRRQLR